MVLLVGRVGLEPWEWVTGELIEAPTGEVSGLKN